MEEHNESPQPVPTDPPVVAIGSDQRRIRLVDDKWWFSASGKTSGAVWAAAIFVGAVAIHLANELTAARLAIPMLIMLGYAWLGYGDARAEPSLSLRATRISQLADSLYFMGFLWTLWALIDSFIFRGLSKDESVFRAFGYALVTTATGMFVRLLLLQFMFWSDDQQALADREIESSLTIFLKSVKDVGDSLSELKTNLTQVNKTHAKSIATANAAITRATEEKLKELDSAIEGVVASITRRADTLNKAVDAATQKANAAAQHIDESTARAAAGAARAEASAASSESAMQACLKMSEDADTLRQTTNALVGRIDTLGTRMTTSETTVKNVDTKVSSSLAQVAVQVAEVTEVAKAAMTVKTDIVELRVNLGRLADDNATLRRNTNSLSEKVESSSSAVSAAAAQAAQSSRTVATVVGDVKSLQLEVNRLSQQIAVPSRREEYRASRIDPAVRKRSWLKRLLDFLGL